jgi:hypothetical protein
MRSCWNLKLSSVIAFFLLAAAGSSFAQFSLKLDSPRSKVGVKKEAYLFPIRPGMVATLSGTMGELRNTHFHAGLDIDTPDVGVPVLSVQDGYISHATTTTSGYGNVLYVTHPDGNTTVYAHLEEFKGEAGEHIRKERYQRKVSEIDLEFKPNQFPVTRGEVIGLSGNTGGSGGPHLHFEVRDKNNDAINPLQYGFAEVKDNVAPFIQKIALKTMDASARINDQFGRFEFSVTKNGNNYSFAQPILATGKIGVEVLGFDKMENSRYRYGINQIEMLIDSQLVFTQNIDKINFGETRGILTLMDFKSVELKNTRFNKLYVEDGNRLGYYSNTPRKQAVNVTKDTPVTIKLKDFNGNVSTVRFILKASPLVAETPILPLMTKPYELDIQENTLKVSVKTCLNEKENSFTLWQQGKNKTVAPAYTGLNQKVYLIDLKTSLPDSAQTCQGTIQLNLVDRIPSETEYRFYSDAAEITFPDKALYDTMFLSFKHDTTGRKETFRIGSRITPLHRAVNITLKPVYAYTLTSDLGVYRKEGNSYSFLPSTWQNGNVNFYSRAFGEFTFRRDTVPPVISKMSVTRTSARLRIRDNLSGIAYFEANIDGQWLLMVYDYKTGFVRSERLDSKKLLKGDFEFKVVDNAGNESIYKQKIL